MIIVLLVAATNDPLNIWRWENLSLEDVSLNVQATLSQKINT